MQSAVSHPTWSFTKGELKGAFLAFWRPFWKSTLLLALPLSVWLAFRLWTDPDPAHPPPQSLLDYGIEGLVIFGFSIFYVWPLGMLVGVFKLSWRLFGAWTLFPLFVFPFVFWGIFWLTGHFLTEQGLDIFEALRLAFQTRGMPMTQDVLGALRVGHAGGPAAVLILIILLPPLLMDSLRIIFDPGVLWQLFQFLLSVSLVCLIGVSLSALISLIPLLRAFVKRLRVRREIFKSAAPKA